MSRVIPIGPDLPVVWVAPDVRILHDAAADAYVLQVRMIAGKHVDFDDYPTLDDALAEARMLLSADEFDQGKRAA